MANLIYDGTTIDFDSTVFPKQLKPEYIVADFQFCLYDAGELKSSLKKIGVDFEESIACPANDESGTVITRTLSKKGKIISKITKIYEKSPDSANSADTATEVERLKSIKYENILRGYIYELESEM